MPGSDSVELWWTWYVFGYRDRDRDLLCAKAVCREDAEYLAELFRKDGLQKVVIRQP